LESLGEDIGYASITRWPTPRRFKLPTLPNPQLTGKL